MVPHPFYISDNLENAVELLCLRRTVFDCENSGETSGDIYVIEVDRVFRLFHLGKPAVITGKDHVKSFHHVFSGKSIHTADIFHQAVDRDCGGSQYVLGTHDFVQPLLVIRLNAGLFLLVRKNFLRQRCKSISKRHQNDSCYDIKQRMHVCDLGSRMPRCPSRHYIRKRCYQTKCDKDNGSDDIEHKMDHGCPLCVPVHSDRSNKGCDTGPDILSEQNENRTVNVDQAA